jgi:hypothetical protein
MVDGIDPVSWLLFKNLQAIGKAKDEHSTLKVSSTIYNTESAFNCPIVDGIVPLNWL